MAVNHKRVLELTENDLKTLVDGFWEDFKDCCNKGLIDDTTEKLTETILKIIIDFKSTEEWIELLKEIDEVSLYFYVDLIESTEITLYLNLSGSKKQHLH